MNIKISKSILVIITFLCVSGCEIYAQSVYSCHYWEMTRDKVNLKIDYNEYYNKLPDGDPNAGHWQIKDLHREKFFDLHDVKPGDFGTGIISLHVQKNDAWGCVKIHPKRNDEGISPEPELLIDEKDHRKDRWDGELAQNIYFTIWADMCNVGSAFAGDGIFQVGCEKKLLQDSGSVETIDLSLADSKNSNVFTDHMNPLKKNATYYLGIQWSVPDTVGNEIQGDLYRADVTFSVVQFDGNRRFVCN